MNNILLNITAISFYTVTTLMLALRARKTTYGSGFPPAALFPAGLALLFHALLLSQLLFHPGGINFGFFNSLALFAWLITIAGLTVSIKTSIQYVGLLLLPINIVTLVLVLIFPSAGHTIPAASGSLQIHIMSSVLSYCLLSIAALLAILLGIQDYQLHSHRPGRITENLPPLQTLENIMFKLIIAGFGLLSLALFSGFLSTHDWFNHKIVFSCIAWLVFLILLCGRYLAGWRGPTAIRWTLGGILLLMLAFFGTKLVLEIILQRG